MDSASLAGTPSPALVVPILAATLFALAALVALLLLPSLSEPAARLVLRSLRRGAPPAHIAFIMDGNRRWASSHTLAPAAGHARGGETLAAVLQWCLDAGVRTVTVFAFSSENFKRAKGEVGAIFGIAEGQMARLLEEGRVLRENGVRVNVIGEVEKLPTRLREVFARAMRDTRGNCGGPILNICFAYTGREEIARAVKTVVRLVDDGEVGVGDVDERLIAALLGTGEGRIGGDTKKDRDEGDLGLERATDRRRLGYPDLVVRTSGEIRLSDFLLMQASDAVISFRRVLWPDMSAWHLVAIILDYQAQRRDQKAVLQGRTPISLPPKSKTFGSVRVQKALDIVLRECYARIDQDASGKLA